jgi:AMP-binding enzyme
VACIRAAFDPAPGSVRAKQKRRDPSAMAGSHRLCCSPDPCRAMIAPATASSPAAPPRRPRPSAHAPRRGRSAGLNVYPAEVESALMEPDGVLECAAYGVPDEKWGEAVAASVVLAPGSGHDRDSIRNNLRTRIAAYKIPKHIEVPAALPRTTSGKVLREHMAQQVTPGAPSLHADRPSHLRRP